MGWWRAICFFTDWQGARCFPGHLEGKTMSEHNNLKIPLVHNNLKILRLPIAGISLNLKQVTHCVDTDKKVFVIGNATGIVLGQDEYDMVISKLAELTHWVS